MPKNKQLGLRLQKATVIFSIFTLLFANVLPTFAAEGDASPSSDAPVTSIPDTAPAPSTDFVPTPLPTSAMVPTTDLQTAPVVTSETAAPTSKPSDGTKNQIVPPGTSQLLPPAGGQSYFPNTPPAADNTPRSQLPKVQQNTGDLVYEYPIAVPPGRNGMQPDLKIAYDSQSPSEGSIYGSNWSDNIPYIQRFNKTGVEKFYSTSTQQYFTSSLDGELATTTNPGSYVARTEGGSFNAYTFTTSTNQWVMKDKNGTQYKFGYSTSTRQDDPSNGTHVYKWMLEEIRDTNNNYTKYTYAKDFGQIYPSSILYTGNSSTDGVFEIDFATGTRTDVTTTTKTGFNVLTKSLINRIDVKASGSLVHQYTVAYTTGDNGTRSLLSTVVESGKDESANTVTVPTTTFSFAAQTPNWAASTTWYTPTSVLMSLNTGLDTGYKIADLNADGLPDMIRSYNAGPNFYEAWINTGHGWTASSTWYPPVLLTTNVDTDLGYKVLDVNGDGRADIIRGYSDGFTISYDAWINNGHGWTQDTSWDPPTGVYFSANTASDTGYKIMDVNGDGLPDF